MPQVETSGEAAILAWNQGRRFILPVLDNFHSGIGSMPPQSECPIWPLVSRPTVLAGPPLACLERVDSHGINGFELVTDAYNERNGMRGLWEIVENKYPNPPSDT
jgi:hypothetical protein